MYLELFKLKELPFRLSPDPQFLYLSKQHARAKAYMESTIWFTDGFAVITGEIGAGKTTLIETFLQELKNDAVVAQVNQTQVTATAFLQIVLAQFGFSPFKMKKSEILTALNQFLTEQHGLGKKVLLIIDEAQNLSLRVLEEVRMLSGIETTKDKVLRIILAGQPELNDKLNSPELVQLTQRVRLRFHLSALTKPETAAYIEHRLEVAGSQGRRIFAEETYPTIYKLTGGIPRLVNTLCDTSLMAAYGRDSNVVTAEDLDAALHELQWVEFAAAARSMKHFDEIHSRSEDSGRTLGRIILAAEGRTVQERELKRGRLVIGRTADNDLQIESRYISRHHCQIVTQTDSCYIEDLNSTNGIQIHSRRVQRYNLNDGDVVRVGKHEIIYIDERRRQISFANPSGTAVIG
jgi:general secretion pathway protein A